MIPGGGWLPHSGGLKQFMIQPFFNILQQAFLLYYFVITLQHY